VTKVSKAIRNKHDISTYLSPLINIGKKVYLQSTSLIRISSEKNFVRIRERFELESESVKIRNIEL